MDLLAFLRERVDSIGGSWPDCREALLSIGKLSMVSRHLADKQHGLQKAIFRRWPEAWSYVALRKVLARGKQLSCLVVARPMGRDEYLNIMRCWRWNWHSEIPWPTCSLLACSRTLGAGLLPHPYPGYRAYSVDSDVYCSSGHAVDSRAYSQVGRGADEASLRTDYLWGQVPYRTLNELSDYLWEQWLRTDDCKIYSFRKTRMVTLNFGCFACSPTCYRDIVAALNCSQAHNYEIGDENNQVVVITTRWLESPTVGRGERTAP